MVDLRKMRLVVSLYVFYCVCVIVCREREIDAKWTDTIPPNRHPEVIPSNFQKVEEQKTIPSSEYKDVSIYIYIYIYIYRYWAYFTSP